jgi:hypothetical protein
VHVRVVRHEVDELLELLGGGQLAVEQQVGHLEEGGLLRELLDGVAAVLEDALVAVDEGDGAAAVGRVQERRVVTHQTEVLVTDLDLPERVGANRSVLDRDFVRFAGPVVRDRQRVLGHGGRIHREQSAFNKKEPGSLAPDSAT